MTEERCNGLRIAMVVHRFPVISETFVLNQAAAMLDRGHDLRLFAFERGDPGESQEAVERYGLMDRLTILRRPPTKLTDRISGAIGSVTRLAATPNVLLNAVNVFRHGHHAANLRLLYTAADVGEIAGFDVVHCQFGSLWHTGLLLARISHQKAGLVVSFRGRDISRYIHEHGPTVYAELFADGDAYLPNCDYFKERLLSIGCPAERITVVRSGLDVERFPMCGTTPAADEPVRLLTVGRLVEKKGIAYSIRAVASLIREGRRVEYTIVGSGPLQKELAQLAADEGAGEMVHFAGRMDHRDIVRELCRHHVFLATSVRAQDGDEDAPVNVLKEAMAAGLPSIGTRHGGIPELIRDGENGFLVPERDPGAIAAVLRKLLDAPQTWSQFGRAGRAWVAEQYDLRRQTQILESVYCQVAGRDGSDGSTIPPVDLMVD